MADDALTPDEVEVVERARTWADKAVAPRAEEWESERRFGSEAFASAATAGLTGVMAPVADGGRGLGPVAMARMFEVIAGVDLGVAFSLVVHNNLVDAVARRGSSALRGRYLQELITGRRLGAFLLTEPGVGSDAAAITTEARKTNDGWILDGSKAWVTNGAAADVLSVYATTDLSRGHRGIAAFIVDADVVISRALLGS